MIEEWRDIVGYEGIYQGSSKGRIRSVDRIQTNKLGRTRSWNGVELKQHKDKRIGYMLVSLCKLGS